MNVLVLTYWSYNEPLIQAATLPYVRIIRRKLPSTAALHLVTFEKSFLSLNVSETEKTKAMLAEEGIRWFPMKYRRFGVLAMAMWMFKIVRLIRFCRKNDIQAIHAFASPIGLAAHIIRRFTGIQYVIDSYEPHAESMVENGSWSKGSLAHRLLFNYERKQSHSARAVLATCEGMRDYATRTYGAVPKRFFVKPACVDLRQFNPQVAPNAILKTQLEGKITCVYAGKIGGIYLSNEIFDFFKVCDEKWGDQFRALMLTDTPDQQVQTMAKAAGLGSDSVITANVAHSEVASYLRLAQFAINPVMPVPSKRYCTSIKDGEYWAMGLPVVIPANISDDSDIIRRENAGAVLEELSQQAYQAAVEKISHLLEDETITDRIRSLATRYRNFETAENIYEKLYGKGKLAFLPTQNYLALIYNSFGDPLYQNLVHQYLLQQSHDHVTYEFDLITFEQKKYAIKNSDEVKAQLTSDGIRWHPLTYHTGRFMLAKKLYDFASATRLMMRIKRRRKTALLIAFANTSAAITGILSKLYSIPMMVYSFEPHSEFLAEFGIWNRGGLRYKLLNRLENAARDQSSYILTGTQHMVDHLEGKVKAQVRRAPSAVDHKVFQFNQEDRQHIRTEHDLGEKRVMIYVGKFGGIYYEKEIAEFFEALWAQDENWHLVVLTPDEKKVVSSFFDSKTLNHVTITEAFSPAEVASWLSAADIGLSAIPPLPSQKFRSPVKVGEYLLCGLPYITCRDVSEDDLWARKCGVGIVVDAVDQDAALVVQQQAPALITSENIREKCRTAGLEYRGIETVHEAFEEALSSVNLVGA